MEVVCGPDDEAFLRKYVSSRAHVAVVVNGVDLDYFDPTAVTEARAAEPTILFCGAMDYNPNIEALRWFFSEIHETLARAIPGLRVLVVGKNPTPEVNAHACRSGVTVTGAVADVRPYYRRAWLQVVPLRIGGGTRLKIVESMALGTPVVSTSIGAQGLGLAHGEEILLADDAKSFTRETIRALRDGGLRSRLEAGGIATARSRFSWKGIGQKLSAIYAGRLAQLSEPAIRTAPAAEAV